MRHSISYAALIAATVCLFSSAAQAQTPLGLDNGTYVLENTSTGAITPTSGHLTNGVPNAGYQWVPLASVTNQQAAPGGAYVSGGNYIWDSTANAYLTSNVCPGGHTCLIESATGSAPSAAIPGADKKTASNFTVSAFGNGLVTSNGSGQYLAAGPGGLTVADKYGHSSVIGPDGATFTGSTVTIQNIPGTSKTVIQDGVITSTTPGFGSTQINGGYVTINGGANTNVGGDVSTLTYLNAASATNGGAWVNNGLAVTGGANVSGGTTTDKLTVTNGATVSGGLTVNGPTQLNGGISVAPNQAVDFGGNVVSGVATPIAPTDAANKAYVDTGLANLLNTEKSDVKKLNGGVAAAMALASPDRTGNQTGAFAVSESFWNGHTATGISAIQQVYNAGSWDFSVGAAASFADTGDVGGRVTGQFGWGGAPLSLK